METSTSCSRVPLHSIYFSFTPHTLKLYNQFRHFLRPPCANARLRSPVTRILIHWVAISFFYAVDPLLFLFLVTFYLILVCVPMTFFPCKFWYRLFSSCNGNS